MAHRVFGPLRAGRVRMVLDFHGLAGRPAATVTAIAARHRVTRPTVARAVARVRAAGARLPLTPGIVTQATRDSVPGEDHRGRVRIAATLNVPTPGPAPAGARRRSAVPLSHLTAARAGARLVAAVGPLDLDTVRSAVARSRRFRGAAPVSADDLAAALIVIGASHDADGRWRPPPETSVPDRYRAVVESAGGRDLTRQQMITILVAAGYSSSSAAGRMSSSHPLFHRTGPDRYRLIGPSGDER